MNNPGKPLPDEVRREVKDYLSESFVQDEIGDTPIWQHTSSGPGVSIDQMLVDIGLRDDKYVARVRLTIEVEKIWTTKQFLQEERLKRA